MLLPSDVSALLGYVRVVNSDVVAAKFTAMRHSCWPSATSSSLATTSLRRSNITEEHARNPAAGSSSLAGRFEGIQKALIPKTKTLYCESMAIPGGLVVDPERLADIGNTTATSSWSNPSNTARTSSCTVPRRSWMVMAEV